jgi:membrane protease subunit HflK
MAAWDDFPKKKGPGRQGDNAGLPLEFPKINLSPIKQGNILLIIVGIVVLWLGTGIFFMVGPDEQGVVLQFGRYNRTAQPGLNFKFPAPIETVIKTKVTKVRREEIGFRISDPGPPARYRDVPSESLMLTGDENIIDIDLVVQYKISNAEDYLFQVRRQRKAIRDATEAAIREVVGRSIIDKVLTVGKFEIQNETRELIQNILNNYSMGIQIVAVQLQDVHPPKQVIDAFKDVVSAKEDRERLINEAQGYKNTVIPETRGKAAQVLRMAEAYREEKVNKAEGDAKKFENILQEYNKAESITRKRLYIETMEEILPGIEKYIVDQKSGGILPILPIGPKELLSPEKK